MGLSVAEMGEIPQTNKSSEQQWRRQDSVEKEKKQKMGISDLTNREGVEGSWYIKQKNSSS